jgi:hypothetical protein
LPFASPPSLFGTKSQKPQISPTFWNQIQKLPFFHHFLESNPKTFVTFAAQTTNSSDYEKNTAQRLSEQISIPAR